MYMLGFKAKVLYGMSTASYSQFSSVIGQASLLAVVPGTASVKTLFKHGYTFKDVCDADLWKALLNYFDIRCRASSVLAKSNHSKNLMHFAVSISRHVVMQPWQASANIY